MNKTGILLLNTGTPEKANYWNVAKYLSEFLMDKRMVDIPWPMRFALVHGIIIPTRLKNSTHAYQKIWTTLGSPLLVQMIELKEALQNNLSNDYVVEIGMRYGTPSIESAVLKLQKAGCTHWKVLPLFPHYASAATGSALEEFFRVIRFQNNIPSMQIVNSFFKEEGFIQAWAQKIESVYDKTDFLLFSYHGLPQKHVNKVCSNTCLSQQVCPEVKNDNAFCYRAQCFSTSRHIAKALNLSDENYGTSFQSRLGKLPWITPYTDEILMKLSKSGVKNLTVACPSFVVDCLETLEEIGIRLKEQWLSVGGEKLTLISCLNTYPEWIQSLTHMVSNEKIE